ncbi:hypothetical protein [Nonomuraea sp. NPDC050786]|uniref:hypothetical protein n=1 Tax=Nonomuraea sp. NPDC050786 TaxID=3154840 RepID=UPI0033FFAD45
MSSRTRCPGQAWRKTGLAWHDGVLLTVPGMEGLTADGFGNLYCKVDERLHRLAITR